MRSDALPPARNCQKHNPTRVLQFVSLFVVALSLPWFTACSAANSAVTPQKPQQQLLQPRTPADRTPRSQYLQVSGTLPAAIVGTPYSASISVSGGKAEYQFSLSWGQLPSGLSLDPTTGSISGVPAKNGVFPFGVHVVDSTGLGGAQAIKLTVSNSGSVTVTLNPGSATVPSAGTLQFTASVSNTTNVGVTWTASKGTISSSGLYSAPTVTSNTSVTVTATTVADSTISATAALTITPATQAPLAITTTGLTGVTSGITYSANLKASGGTTPYSWSLASGSLPSGIGVSSAGSVSGTTTQTGQFTFTVQVSDSSSPKQTATQALTLTVSGQTGNGSGVQQSFFGADFNGSKVWPPTDGQNQIATLASVRLWDDGIKWGQLNTANGVYNWTGLDNWLDRAASANMDVLYTFGDTPQFAAAATAPSGCLSPGPYSCAAPTDVNSDGTGTDAYFSAFVTALVTHAAGRISYYELWNEPDCNCFWSGTQAQLVRMGKDAAAIIRSLDPNAKILSPSAHGPTMATWFDGYVAAGGAPNFDIVNVHMRGQDGTNGNPEAFLTVYGEVIAETQKRNLTSLPLWDDEHGILQTNGLTDPDMLAGYVARSAILRAGVGIQRQYVYTWDSKAPYGLQGNASGTAWNQVATWLIGHTASACTSSGTVYTCALDYGQIVWDTAQSCSNGVCTTSNYTYPASYVWYHDLDGNKTALSGKTVAIGYKPILLENQ
jgi:Putative Ig domain